jgi:hypothetical protein
LLRELLMELTGKQRGTGALVKADIQDDKIVFRGVVKAKVPFKDLAAESRGTLLTILYKEHIFDFAAGSKAQSFAAKIVKN